MPAELEPYINAVKHFNRSGQLRYYPGSPLIVLASYCANKTACN
ncbi:23S rRNA (adenine(2030)-N(6))-methyltransferase RlmJ [Escherichia coli]